MRLLQGLGRAPLLDVCRSPEDLQRPTADRKPWVKSRERRHSGCSFRGGGAWLLWQPDHLLCQYLSAPLPLMPLSLPGWVVTCLRVKWKPDVNLSFFGSCEVDTLRRAPCICVSSFLGSTRVAEILTAHMLVSRMLTTHFHTCFSQSSFSFHPYRNSAR